MTNQTSGVQPMKKTENLVTQVHNKENKDFECHHCPKAFGKNKTLMRHMRNCHLNVNKFPCNLCNKTFSEQQRLTAHLKDTHHVQLGQLVQRTNGKLSSEVSPQGHLNSSVQESSTSGSASHPQLIKKPSPLNQLLSSPKQQIKVNQESNGSTQLISTKQIKSSTLNQLKFSKEIETDQALEVSTDFATNEDSSEQTPPLKKLSKMDEIKRLHQTLNQSQNSLLSLIVSKGTKRPNDEQQLARNKKQSVEIKALDSETSKKLDQLSNQINVKVSTKPVPSPKSNLSRESKNVHEPQKPENEIGTFFSSSPIPQKLSGVTITRAQPSKVQTKTQSKDEIANFFSQSPKTPNLTNKIKPETHLNSAKTTNDDSKS
jgi:hypothetical protein